jgi:DNA (cytosine-5)-methyltransferase 3A
VHNCNDLSSQHSVREGLKGKYSSLFYDYVRLLEQIKPKYFMLENVKMHVDDKNEITRLLGVEPIFIDSKLVSAQSRQRWYWTNIPNITQPKDKGILLKDVVKDGYVNREKSFCITES